MQLSEAHLRALEARKVDPEFAIRMGIYTGRRLLDADENVIDFVPDPTGNLLCFPFRERGEIIQVKARFRKDGAKRFTQLKDRQKTFWNADVLLDPHMMQELEDGIMELLISEGEFDAEAALEAGHYTSVSVPNGAPPARDAQGNLIHVPSDAAGIDFENDDAFSYLVRHIEALSRIRKFIIATDDDEPGQRLAKELVRRLGPGRCRRIIYPKQPVVPDPETGELRPVKDLDEVRQHYGLEFLALLIKDAKEWPVLGLYNISDYPDPGELELVTTRLSDEFDAKFKLYPGAFVPVTGVPNTGKSEVVKQMAINLAKFYGWHTAIFPGEEMVKPFLEQSLKTKYLGKPKSEWSEAESAAADAFVERYISIIGADPRDDTDDDITLDRLLELAAVSVLRNGTRLLIIDPWNEIEHERPAHESLTEYVGRAIKKIKRFARRHGVCVIVVAHPKKVESQPTLYDISDSAHWFNKADLGLIIDTDEPFGIIRDFIIAKVRFAGITGEKGIVPMEFVLRTRTYRGMSELDVHRHQQMKQAA